MRQICDITKILHEPGFINTLVQDSPCENKERILNYLKHGKVQAVAAGYAKDIITGEPIKGELTALTDDTFEWRSDIIYYFDKYNIRLNADFISHALTN